MSTIKSVYLQHLNGTTPNATMDTNGNFTVGGTVSGASSNMFRNRIINGDMRIDQRNGGSSISTNGYPVDRFYIENYISGTLTAQRSSDAPTGFVNSVIHTVSSATSPASGSYLFDSTSIEGYNMSDLAWGTSSAKTVTLSFWVKSSVSGTYGIGLRNGATNFSYVTTYTINSTNTWEYKTITIAGPTSGTWYNDTNLGVRIFFDLGSGSNFNGTLNTWQSGSYWRTSGCVNFISNASATWQIAGVQFEAGTTATSFEFRHYSAEFSLCQRYYQTGRFTCHVLMEATNTTAPTAYRVYQGEITLPVYMRSTPTVTPCRFDKATISNGSSVSRITNEGDYAGTINAVPYVRASEPNTVMIYLNTSNTWYAIPVFFKAEAEL